MEWSKRDRYDDGATRFAPSLPKRGLLTMRRPAWALLLLVVFSSDRASSQSVDDGYEPLFDGKTLNGWKFVNAKDNFLVKDGLLVMNKGMGWLATEKTFDNFSLRVRCRFVTPGADSGIFIRSSLEGKNWTSKGYQIQNMDDSSMGMVIGMGVPLKETSHKPNLVKTAKKPSREWNEMVIVADGKHVDVTLNGQLVAQSDSAELTSGHIGLQAEGGILEFEKIEIKLLRK
jgi:hypothetical protein